jgi:hypothetical protein
MNGEPTPFEIAREGHAQIASNGLAGITLLDGDGRLFRRRAVKGVGTDAARNVEWAVAELGGVRVYFDGTNVVVTRQDLMP